MTESKKYLNFFKTNCLLIVVPLAVGLIGGVIYQSSRPITYTKTELLEIGESAGSINDRIALTDQAVTLSRSDNVRQSLGLDGAVKLVIFKPSPFSISVAVSSTDQTKLEPNLNKEVNYLMTKFPANPVGEAVLSQSKTSGLRDILTGLGVGLLIGILASLMRTYLKNY